MSILVQQDLVVPYLKKTPLTIVFPYEIVDIHNSFDYLEELWESIVYTLSSALTEQGLSIVEGKTDINENYTTIAYVLVLLVPPPSVNFSFLYEKLVQKELPHQLTITTPNPYNKQELDILLQTQ